MALYFGAAWRRGALQGECCGAAKGKLKDGVFMRSSGWNYRKNHHF
jgi:hypothetical protein